MRRNSFRSALVGAVLLAALAGAQGAGAQEKSPTARGTGGAAATVDLLATQAAIDVLRNGGNAVDAAVAAAAVLGVTEPFSCGIGGGGFMVIRTAKGKVTTIDGREKSPATMRPDTFWENGAPLTFNDARFSGLSAGVPGTAATWVRALASTARSRSRRRWRPASPWRATASRSTRRSSTRRRGKRVLRRRPVDRRALPGPGRNPEGRRHEDHQPGHGQDLRGSWPAAAAKGFYRGAVAAATAEAAATPADRPDRRPHLAQGPDDDRRPRALQGARARPDELNYRGLTSTAWARRRAAARPSPRR